MPVKLMRAMEVEADDSGTWSLIFVNDLRAATTPARLILNLVVKVWHFVAVSCGPFPRGSYWRHRPLGSGLRLSRNDKRSEGMDQDSWGAR